MNRIRELREDMDLRQADVAASTGIDQRTLSNYETGKTNPDSYAIIRLCDFFNVSADYLIGRTDERTPKISSIEDSVIKIQKELLSILEKIKNL